MTEIAIGADLLAHSLTQFEQGHRVVDNEAGVHLKSELADAMGSRELCSFLPVGDDSFFPLPVKNLRELRRPAVGGPVGHSIGGITSRTAGETDDHFHFQSLGQKHSTAEGLGVALRSLCVRMNTASIPQAENFSIISSVDKSGNAGSKTPIGILRATPGSSGVSCMASARAAVRAGSATEAARALPVVVRKFLRLGDGGKLFTLANLVRSGRIIDLRASGRACQNLNHRGHRGHRGNHSWRRASIGSRREARMAGIIPLTSPTIPRMTVATINVTGSMSSRMSPASACLANTL